MQLNYAMSINESHLPSNSLMELIIQLFVSNLPESFSHHSLINGIVVHSYNNIDSRKLCKPKT